MCPSSGEITLICATLCICHSVWMTVWYAGWFHPAYHPHCSHPHRVTNTKCRVDTTISPDYGLIVARNV